MAWRGFWRVGGVPSSWRLCREECPPGRELQSRAASMEYISRKSNYQEGKSLLTLKFSAKRSIFTRKRMLND
jgi:hypothetical protein